MFTFPDGTQKNVLFLTIPSFRSSRKAVLVNLTSLAVREISFQDMSEVSDSNISNDRKRKGLHMKKKTEDDGQFAIDYSDSMEIDATGDD